MACRKPNKLFVLAAGLLLASLVACESPDRRDFEYRISKAEGERDHLQLALDDERAKVVILQERLAKETQGREVDQAELNLARNRAAQLEQANEKLLALLEERTLAESARPAVPASPLPEKIDRQLQAMAERHGGRVWYDRGRGAISFADDRLFVAGSDEIRSGSESPFGELADIAAQLPAADYEVIVVGHTDDTPISSTDALARHPSNWHLSVHRAIAVKSALVSAGLPESRMGVMGYGPYRPIDDEDSARNRRVEVFFARRGEVRPLAPVQPEADQ